MYIKAHFQGVVAAGCRAVCCMGQQRQLLPLLPGRQHTTHLDGTRPVYGSVIWISPVCQQNLHLSRRFQMVSGIAVGVLHTKIQIVQMPASE